MGCDGVVGSGATRDTCGICGGVGKSCKLYEGIFMEPILPKGHQPVTTIPRGAMSLNISELRSSPNYLGNLKILQLLQKTKKKDFALVSEFHSIFIFLGKL